jgi:hypothetical protein
MARFRWWRRSKLAGESLIVQAEGGEGTVGIDDVAVDCSLIGTGLAAQSSQGSSDEGDAVEAPGVSASSWVSWVSVGVAGWYSSKN